MPKRTSISLQDSWYAFVQGDVAAFDEIFDAMWEDCYRYAYRIYGQEHEAKEVVQELFIRLWDKRMGLPIVENPQAYLIRALKNGIINQLASAKKQPLQLDALTLKVPFAPDVQAHNEQKALLNAAIQQLPEKTRQVLVLSHIEGYSTQEIALVTGSAPQTVRNQLTIALRKLHALLSKGALLLSLILLHH
jgi:RNA polymerase sigma-70 factor (family 1)